MDFKPDSLIISRALHPIAFLLAEHSSVCLLPTGEAAAARPGTLLQPDGIRGYSATTAVISAPVKAAQDTTDNHGKGLASHLLAAALG